MDEARKKRREKYANYILTKKQVPCLDCGNSFPEYCMDFHHIDEESKDILLKTDRSSMVNNMKKWGKKKIDEELSKCVVLCANCHRIRHHK